MTWGNRFGALWSTGLACFWFAQAQSDWLPAVLMGMFWLLWAALFVGGSGNNENGYD